MTQVMRDKLQALVKDWIVAANTCCGDSEGRMLEECARDIESILATEPPAVTVRAGWYAKDLGGFWYLAEKPVFMNGWWVVNSSVAYDRVNRIVNDPWAESHPNGGPECCMEVK